MIWIAWASWIFVFISILFLSKKWIIPSIIISIVLMLIATDQLWGIIAAIPIVYIFYLLVKAINDMKNL